MAPAADVWVRESRDGARLTLEAGRVGARAEELDHDLTAELRVLRQPTSAMPPSLRRSTRRYRPPIVSGTTAVAYGRR
jgi:hypothetical protein